MIGTPGYAASRTDENHNEHAGAALLMLRWWLLKREACCHVRYADGEFYSILGRIGPNADGQEHLPQTLGKDLAASLERISRERKSNVLVGGYWHVPPNAWTWLVGQGYDKTIPWCPVQIFVDGIVSMETMRFLETVKAARGAKFLIANQFVCDAVADALDATPVPVPLPAKKVEEHFGRAAPGNNAPGYYGGDSAYAAMPEVEATLRAAMKPGDIAIWCAGLGCKPSLYKMFSDIAGTSHFDMGCFFDGAAGLISRTWLTDGRPDHRLIAYREKYLPWLLGKHNESLPGGA
jgi:hypothetical protein